MPILSEHSIEFISRSVEQTRRFGMRMGALLQTGNVICLVGDLGSGKTTLVQGIAMGWGSLDHVTSPTFVLVNVYRHAERKLLFHLDAYRISDPKEAIDLDLDNLVERGVLVIEWAERIQQALPADNLWLNIHYVNEEQRDLVIRANGEQYKTLLNRLKKQVYGIQ